MIKKNYKRVVLIFLLFILAFLLVNYYRPFKAKHGFFDFGLADSGSGMISIVIVYLFLSKKSMSFLESLKLACLIFSLYLTQEILSYFSPFIGTFDVKDLLYYFFGLVIVFYFDIRKREVFHEEKMH